ncbi:Rrf2 family transcriptional regulator [Candidatus Parcubacteria bacterium]|nr:Rrf2 family transcriptional regulator [Patescibacteria group bacterium]MBU4308984.1 Rrf2 family transcriptional regulator [Patescibacteria group bacterium]MBU4431701.1 Rrf2 family transcriptional regulator [Patescibacteria group bacterium]MBU4577344.1 Rrf2 family transcriptional regulator [Patescibacteria group bacterium]MCG2697032.1 Rrf2 family transcriptional regulator [Candidatus Parcubacteria bacterium]
MKFSTKTTYGLRAMILLAQEKNKSVPLSMVAEREDISLKYLERIFAQLKKANLITSEMGSMGGYCLAGEAKDITVYDIVKTLEGEIAPFYCVAKSEKVFCGHKCNCGVTGVLKKVQDSLVETLRGIKLVDLI